MNLFKELKTIERKKFWLILKKYKLYHYYRYKLQNESVFKKCPELMFYHTNPLYFLRNVFCIISTNDGQERLLTLNSIYLLKKELKKSLVNQRVIQATLEWDLFLFFNYQKNFRNSEKYLILRLIDFIEDNHIETNFNCQRLKKIIRKSIC